MSFTIQQSVNVSKVVTSQNLVLKDDVEELSITYTAKYITYMSTNIASVLFETSVDGGVSTGIYTFDFDWASSGFSLDAAEEALRLSLVGGV